MKMKKPFDHDAHIAEIERAIAELEKLPKSNAVEGMLYRDRRELRYWKAHKSHSKWLAEMVASAKRRIKPTNKEK